MIASLILLEVLQRRHGEKDSCAFVGRDRLFGDLLLRLHLLIVDRRWHPYRQLERRSHSEVGEVVEVEVLS